MNNMIVKAGVLGVLVGGMIASNAAPSFAGQFAQNHPRRAEVLQRSRNQQNRINNDKGQLGVHYRQLTHEEKAIRQQQRRDARINGGFITKGQQHQLNREENRVNRQVQRDHQ